MNSARTSLLTFAVSIAFAAHAEQKRPSQPRWPEEPRSFFGVLLGEPLESQHGAPKCRTIFASDKTLRLAPNFKEFCYIPKLPDVAEGQVRFQNGPPLGFEYTLIAETNAKRQVAALVLTFPRSNFNDIHEVLEAKYGKPVERGTRIHKNGSIDVEWRWSKWEGPNVLMVIREAENANSEQTRLSLSTKARVEEQDAARRKRLADIRGKL
jgi:hypothetical protein